MKRITSILAAGAFALSLAACQNSDAEKHAAAAQQQQRTIDSMKMEIAKQRVIDSMQEVAQFDKEQAVANTAAATAAASRRRTTTRRSSSYSNNNTGYSSASTSNAAYDPTPVAPAKRGWSAKAKGAVIGAGAGAIGGAIINKRNRAAGAIIGGVGGAAVGTGIGAILDHKNGR